MSHTSDHASTPSAAPKEQPDDEAADAVRRSVPDPYVGEERVDAGPA